MTDREDNAYLRFAWLFLAGAALGTFFAVYWRSLPYPPVYDDFAQVIENRAIRYLFHPRIFLEAESARSRPLAYVTFALSYYFAGMSLSGLRIVSLIVHALNSVLVGLFYRRLLSGSRLGAVLAGALFLLHPLATDSVIYLSARGSLLVLCFLLFALLIHGRTVQTAATWLGFLFFAGLAFFSRESAAVVAPLLVAQHWLTRRRGDTELAPYLFPLVLGGAVVLYFKSGYLGAAWNGYFSIQGDVAVRSTSDYLRLSLSLWPRILGLLLLPGTLALDHQLTLPPTWLAPGVLFGILLWAGFAVSLVLFFRTRSRWLFPVLWLFLSLLPTNSVFPVLDPLSERHIYIALPALAWLFALAVDALGERVTAAVPAAIILVLGAGSTVTLGRVLDWETQAGNWLAAHRLSPHKFRIALNASLALLTERGDREGALRELVGTLNGLPPGAIRYEEETETLDLLAETLNGLAQDRNTTPMQLWHELGLGDGYWSELVALRAELGKVPPAQWHRDWASALERVKRIPVSITSRDPAWGEHSLELLRAKELSAEGKKAEALALYEKVILPFGETHFPYWIARENLGDLYLDAHRDKEALRQYELAESQYKVFKRFPVPLEEKLYLNYRKSGDLYRATDAIGELVRSKTDDPKLRQLYAELLRLRSDKHAARQAKEAEYFSHSGIGPDDAREILRP